MKLVVLALIIMLTLVGCSLQDYRKADGLVLCDPMTGDAYYVEHHFGGNSTVAPANTQLAKLCGEFEK